MSEPGKIRVDFYINCGRCGNEESILETYNKRQTGLSARKDGWKKTRNFGWTCPHCLKDIKDRKEVKDDNEAPGT
jgi:hypothetical protein